MSRLAGNFTFFFLSSIGIVYMSVDMYGCVRACVYKYLVGQNIRLTMVAFYFAMLLIYLKGVSIYLLSKFAQLFVVLCCVCVC